MSPLLPSLFRYGAHATALLRITLGVVFVYFAYEKLIVDRPARIAFFEKLAMRPPVVYFAAITAAELLAGVSLTLGWFTQGGGIVTALLMFVATIVKWRKPTALPHNTVEFYVLLTVVSVTVVVSGPGAWALDAAR